MKKRMKCGAPMGLAKRGRAAGVTPHDAEIQPIVMARIRAWSMGGSWRGSARIFARIWEDIGVDPDS